MKKIFTTIISLLCVFCSLAQVSDMEYIPNHGTGTAAVLGTPGSPRAYYKNLQKYWFYRYRLINDFMMMGTEEGMSIPCQARRWDHGAFHNHSLDFTDATIQLGHYIQVLATEHAQLNSNGLSTHRSDDELSLAINAFNRIDIWAEAYCYDLDNSIGSYPGYPGTVASPIIPPMPSAGSTLNGFFIRDDVPFTAWFSPDWTSYSASGITNLTNYEYFHRHFNRPGLDPRDFIEKDVNPLHNYKTYGIFGSAFESRYNGYDPYTVTPQIVIHDATYASTAPRYPQEESQDQVVEIAAGMAFVSNYFPIGSTLSNHAKSALARVLRYPFSCAFIPKIHNPLNGHCVFGGHPEAYPNACDFGGANIMPCTTPSERILHYYASAGSGLATQAIANEPAFQFMKYAVPHCNAYASFSGYYAALFAAMVRGWRSLPVLSAFGGGIDVTRQTLWDNCASGSLAFPHLPLIYKIFNNDYHSFAEQNIKDLLDVAPVCGPYAHNISGTTTPTVTYDLPNLEWSGNDRLHEPFHREIPCEAASTYGDDASYNGLDYMLLFNLFAITQGTGYVQALNNPYYDDNYNITYPDNNGYGSSTQPLKLNFLQYVNFQNCTFNANSSVHIRVGQSQTLAPGTYTIPSCPTCSVVFEVRDYNCEDEEYNFASLGKHIPNDKGETITVYEPIEYFPNGRSYVAPVMIDPKPHDDTAHLPDNYLTSAAAIAERDSLICMIVHSGDAEQTAWVEDMFTKDSVEVILRHCSGWSISSEEIKCELYPNPTSNKAYLDYELNDVAEVSVKLTNVVGQDLSGNIEQYTTHQEAGKHQVVINADNLVSGCYYITIKANNTSITKKLIVI